jgi:hypothetical protein
MVVFILICNVVRLQAANAISENYVAASATHRCCYLLN